ncbi:MAG: PCMD domain-containing protein [Bacteroidales bacterium]|nr:PCMD domain-containing protein [Bacteroidales bacterium]
MIYRFFKITIALVFIHFGAFSQQISNSGFENWTNTNFFEDPDQFATSNMFSYIYSGSANVTKTMDAHAGNYAVRLQTVPSPEGSLNGAIFIGTLGEGSIGGGIPFDERPDSIHGYAKYNIGQNDTAYVAVLFKKFGAPLGICFARFHGTQNTYSYFSAPVQWLIPIISPDSMATAVLSSSIFTEPVPGSTIYIDDIEFVGSSSIYPNGGFEDWNSYSSEEPDDWFTSNIFGFSLGTSTVTKTTDSYEGNFAVRIESKLTVNEDTVGFITNGTFGEDGISGGMPVSLIPDKLTGYYKYSPVGPDTALAGMTLYHYNENQQTTQTLEEKYLKLPAANEYTYFELQIDYFTLPEPDTVNIAFGSGNFDDAGSYIGLGSVLQVDQLGISYKPHIVGTDVMRNELPNVFPNPAKDKVIFEMFGLIHQEASVNILNETGQTVYSGKRKFSGAGNLQINTGDFDKGIFFYHIQTGHREYQGKFIVQ